MIGLKANQSLSQSYYQYWYGGYKGPALWNARMSDWDVSCQDHLNFCLLSPALFSAAPLLLRTFQSRQGYTKLWVRSETYFFKWKQLQQGCWVMCCKKLPNDIINFNFILESSHFKLYSLWKAWIDFAGRIVWVRWERKNGWWPGCNVIAFVQHYRLSHLLSMDVYSNTKSLCCLGPSWQPKDPAQLSSNSP